jgi:TonB family protein
MRAITLCLIFLVLALPAVLPAADGDPAYAYHLRVVRVSGPGIDPGAALGWSADDGEPVVLPTYEAWGTPDQLDGLAKTLGGERADPVTGFFIRSDDGLVPSFERPVYVGGEVLDLSFHAFPPAQAGDAHELTLKVVERNGGANPLAEATLQVKTERTVAIALPSPLEDDWLVLAVTLLSQDVMDEQSSKVGHIRLADDPVLKPVAITNKIPPRYPEAARKERLQGDVVLQVILDKEGIPRAPVVLRMSPGCEELAAAAVDAVLQWRYEPARLDGRAVPVYFNITVKFELH